MNVAFLRDTPAALDDLFRGLARGRAQEVDHMVIDDVRNFLMLGPGGQMLDLPALNMQRGRDHGLCDYNAMRVAYGLAPVAGFDQIHSDPAVQALLALAYAGDLNNIDPWLGGIAEEHLDGASVGPLVMRALVDQFTRLRDGDRFFYLNDPDLSAEALAGIIDLDQVRLSRILLDNTSITHLPENVFFTNVPEPATFALVALGLFAAGIRLRHR